MFSFHYQKCPTSHHVLLVYFIFTISFCISESQGEKHDVSVMFLENSSSVPCNGSQKTGSRLERTISGRSQAVWSNRKQLEINAAVSETTPHASPFTLTPGLPIILCLFNLEIFSSTGSHFFLYLLTSSSFWYWSHTDCPFPSAGFIISKTNLKKKIKSGESTGRRNTRKY